MRTVFHHVMAGAPFRLSVTEALWGILPQSIPNAHAIPQVLANLGRLLLSTEQGLADRPRTQDLTLTKRRTSQSVATTGISP